MSSKMIPVKSTVTTNDDTRVTESYIRQTTLVDYLKSDASLFDNNNDLFGGQSISDLGMFRPSAKSVSRVSLNKYSSLLNTMSFNIIPKRRYMGQATTFKVKKPH